MSSKITQEDTFSKLINELLQVFDRLLEESVEKLKSDILKKLSARDKVANKAEIDDGCNRIRDLVKSRFELNIDKFELYSRRNLLSNYAIQNQSQQSPSKKSKSATKAVNSPYGDNMDTLKSLRQNYLDLQQKYTNAVHHKAELESLQEEMDKVVFSVRVAKQAFENDALDESVSLIHEHSKQLESLVQRAYYVANKIQEINQHEGSGDAGVGLVAPTAQRHQHSININMPVVIGSDTSKLTSSIRQKLQ